MILVNIFKPKRKNGSLPVSRFFRQIFEFRKIKLVLGIQLAGFLFIAGSFRSPRIAFTKEEAILTRPENAVITETTFKKPVNGRISQNYSWYHPALDIAARLKNPVYPIAQGKVKETTYGRWGYGHKIIIEHQGGYWSLYAHLDQIKVRAGQKVNKNTVIGTVGLTGWTSGSHLHLEIRRENHPFNPQEVLPDFKP